LIIFIKNVKNNESVTANEDSRDNEKILYINGKEKTIKIDQTKFNLSDEIIVKNNTILMSENRLSKLFKVSVIKNDRKIMIKHCEFFDVSP
jgi:pectate lyase